MSDLVHPQNTHNNDTAKKILIVGAGPAGLMAALQLAEQGFAVEVFERMPSAGRKFLMAGRGGLNLTHSEGLETFLATYQAQSEWVRPFIKRFRPKDLRAFADALDAKTFVGSSGRVFPKAMKASPLLRALLRKLTSLGVRLNLRHDWKGWDEAGHAVFDVGLAETGGTERKSIPAGAYVLALGGASWPRLGSDGAWTSILQKQGVRVEELKPSNMGFRVEWSPMFCDTYAGTALKSVRLYQNHMSKVGELLITANGLEGGLLYAFSGILRDQLDAQGFAEAKLDLCPQWTRNQCEMRLAKQNPKQSLSNKLRKGLGLSGVRLSLFNEARAAGALYREDEASIVRLVKGIPLHFTAYEGLERAISSAGGVEQAAVNENLMLRRRPGVFVCGEMLDWEAPTGGYLLQACFATGFAAAKGVTDYLGNSIADEPA